MKVSKFIRTLSDSPKSNRNARYVSLSELVPARGNCFSMPKWPHRLVARPNIRHEFILLSMGWEGGLA